MENSEKKELLVMPEPQNFGATIINKGEGIELQWPDEQSEKQFNDAMLQYIDCVNDELDAVESVERESEMRVVTDDDLEPDFLETTKADFEQDNGETPPLDEKDMEELEKQQIEFEKQVKFVIIGGNEPAVNQYFMDSLSQADGSIKIYELSVEEIKFIVNSRAEKQAETIAVSYLNDEGYRKRVNDWVLILMQNHIKSKMPDIDKETMRKYFDGEMELMFTKKTLKEASKLSWTEFDELMNSLKLFNIIKYDLDNPNLFSLTLNDNEIIENQKSELRHILNIGNAVVFNLLKSKHIKTDDVEKLEDVKSTILDIIGKI